MKPETSSNSEDEKTFTIVEKLTSSKARRPVEARILSEDDRQLALGVNPNGHKEKASHGRMDSSVRKKRGHRKRGPRSMGRFPFLTAAERLLEDTKPFYADSTFQERKRKFKRIYKILVELKDNGRINTTSSLKMTEYEVKEFIGWCKKNLDASTTAKYLRFLDEILQSVGNNSVSIVKLRYRHLIPKQTLKSIKTIPKDSLKSLLIGDFSLEKELWDWVGKTAIALYSHCCGPRVSEIRLTKLKDLDIEKLRLRISEPKGKCTWANAGDEVPIMPGIEAIVQEYLEFRNETLRNLGLNPDKVEPLFIYITRNNEVKYWSLAMWQYLKQSIEKASGIRFRWKDFRPTFAQSVKDNGASIEAVAKCLRHKDCKTTEQFYARIRSETAFSEVRQAWEASVASVQKPLIE